MTMISCRNVPEKTLTSNTYDEIGRLTEQKSELPSTLLKYKYNIRGWIKEINGPMFKQMLYYNDCANQVNACYNGNISEIAWCDNGYNEAGNFEPNIWRNYRFTYDGLNRLIKADYGEEEPRSNNMRYELINQPDYSVQYSYDFNSNMKELSRKGMNMKQLMDTYESWSFGDVDKLTLSYDGNQLQKVYDYAEDILIEGSMDFKDEADTDMEYAYDSNGNMTKDLNKGITEISYNLLNLPKTVIFADGHITEYTYDASGRKLGVEYKIDKSKIFAPLESVESGNSDVISGGSKNNPGKILPGTQSLDGGSIREGGKITVPKEPVSLIDTKLKRDYCGSYIYKDNILERVVIENGYIENGKFHYFIKDYQGNNRVVMDANNRVVETNDYYPYGMLFCESSTVQPYKYGGKELDRTNGLNLYDSSARQHDPAFGRLTTIDPLAEKYYSISPYAYCAGNPIRFIDPDGREWKEKKDEEIAKQLQQEITKRDKSSAKKESDINNKIKKIDNNPKLSPEKKTQQITKLRGKLENVKSQRTVLSTLYKGITQLGVSKTLYTFNTVGAGITAALSSMNDDTIVINNYGTIGSRAHEAIHALQYDNGKITFNPIGSNNVLMQNPMGLEIQAYATEYTITNGVVPFSETVYPRTIFDINLKWLYGLKDPNTGIYIYRPNNYR